MMGSSDGYDDEKPIHEVSLSSFMISQYEVTQKEWLEVMGSNPSSFKGSHRPVENVSWHDAIDYCNKRSVKEGLTPCYSGSGNNIACNWMQMVIACLQRLNGNMLQRELMLDFIWTDFYCRSGHYILCSEKI